MMSLWGPMEPIAAERVMVIDEGDRIPLGAGRSIEVMATPGHANDRARTGDQLDEPLGSAIRDGPIHFGHRQEGDASTSACSL